MLVTYGIWTFNFEILDYYYYYHHNSESSILVKLIQFQSLENNVVHFFLFSIWNSYCDFSILWDFLNYILSKTGTFLIKRFQYEIIVIQPQILYRHIKSQLKKELFKNTH